jgi:hypothetical protein
VSGFPAPASAPKLLRSELCPVIRDDGARIAPPAKYFVFESPHGGFRGCSTHGERLDPFRKYVGYHEQEPVPSWCPLVGSHIIDGDGLPRPFWNVGSSWCACLDGASLGRGADEAGSEMLVDVLGESRPRVLRADGSDCLFATRMASVWRVVELMQYPWPCCWWHPE